MAGMRKYLIGFPGFLETLAALAGVGFATFFTSASDARGILWRWVAAIAAVVFVQGLRMRRRTSHLESELTRFGAQMTEVSQALNSETAARTGLIESAATRMSSLESELTRFGTRMTEVSQALNSDTAARMSSLESEPTCFGARMTEVSQALNSETAARTGSFDAKFLSIEGNIVAIRGILELNGGRLQKLERDAELMRKGTVSLMSSGRLPADYYTAGSFDPERGFLSIIARHVSSTNAIDVGANRGDFTYALRKVGFAVDAFEPLPDLAAELERRFAQDNKVRVHCFACSDRDGTANLQFASADDPALDATLFATLETHHTFDGLNFERGAEVRLRRLDTVLASEKKYSVGLLKTDTEGHDIAVLDGAKNIDAEVLLVEYWDEHFIFNSGTTRNTINDYLASFDKARFPLCVIMWRGISRGEFGFIVGPSATPRGSWGNLLFTRDASLVDEIVEWARSTYGSDRVVSSTAPIADVIKTPAGLNSP